ncbi:MAG: hypothetical protein KGI58_03160 [Patescibacteria group bacterium]|nr:hypothetical protein [Patescibacteria group bacterium]
MKKKFAYLLNFFKKRLALSFLIFVTVLITVSLIKTNFFTVLDGVKVSEKFTRYLWMAALFLFIPAATVYFFGPMIKSGVEKMKITPFEDLK